MPAGISTTRGFTLIELSAVVIILGLLLGGALTYMTQRGYQEKLAITNKRMDMIEEAIADFRRLNNRVPRVADRTLAITSSTFGTEMAQNAGNYVASTITGGMVPVGALNLSPEIAFDGWGRKFSYAVQREYTDTNSFTTLNIASTPTMRIYTTLIGSPGPQISRSVYALISHGRNGHGAYLANGTLSATSTSASEDEKYNCQCANNGSTSTRDPYYIQRTPNLDTASSNVNYYDDIVRFKTRFQLTGRSLNPESPVITSFAPTDW